MRYYRHGRGLVLRQSSSLLLLDCSLHSNANQNDNSTKRRPSLPEEKMVIESSPAQQNLPMSATFAPTATAGTKRHVNGQADSVETELRDVANGHDVTLVPQTP